jgi:hypothetical protein
MEPSNGYAGMEKVTIKVDVNASCKITNKYNASYHWKECSCGGVLNKERHTLALTTNTTATTHEYKCSNSDCGYTKSEAHTFQTVPDSIVSPTCGTPGSHDEKCTQCNYQRHIVDSATGEHDFSITEYDDTYHWKTCSNCSAISGKIEHTLEYHENNDSYHDVECNGCAYIFTEEHTFVYEPIDDTHHIKRCTKCGASFEEACNFTTEGTDTCISWCDNFCGNTSGSHDFETEEYITYTPDPSSGGYHTYEVHCIREGCNATKTISTPCTLKADRQETTTRGGNHSVHCILCGWNAGNEDCTIPDGSIQCTECGGIIN